MQTSVTHEFTMDPNLLVSVIKSQAGTLPKALVEGVMNSIDAGATRVDVLVDATSFQISDDGRGFADAEEIRVWFGRFGTPHIEGDAVYGRFRMGRGQMMSFASTEWQSGEFVMKVDIETRGLSYDLEINPTPVKGCTITGKLYSELADYKLKEVLTELKKYVAYTPKPVYVNGELYGQPPKTLKKYWSFEDDDAFYKVIPGSHELQVHNQGVFVEDMRTWRIGMGGIVVSKTAVEVNFARNSVMEDKCPVWARIRTRLEKVVMEKLVGSKSLEDGERKFLARRLSDARYQSNVNWREAKVITDPTGKHLAVSQLRKYKNFVYVEKASALACAAHGENDTFVVTDATLNRFGVGDLQSFIHHLQSLSSDLIDPNYQILDVEKIKSYGFGDTSEVPQSALARRERAAFATLCFLNTALAQRLVATGVVARVREMRIGKQKGNKFVAWTDGASYITVNKKFFKKLDSGLDGVLEWLMTLVHEYTHDTDDSESHDHEEVFYRKFHDTCFGQDFLRMGALSREGLIEYLQQLNLNGLSRPSKLRMQLRGKVGSSRSAKVEHSAVQSEDYDTSEDRRFDVN